MLFLLSYFFYRLIFNFTHFVDLLGMRIESQNDDYDSEDPTTAAMRRTLGSHDEGRISRSIKPKPVAVAARPRSVTFRPASDEIKNMVVTNAMVSRPHQTAASDQINKYGVNVINERALGKVCYPCIYTVS